MYGFQITCQIVRLVFLIFGVRRGVTAASSSPPYTPVAGYPVFICRIAHTVRKTDV